MVNNSETVTHFPLIIKEKYKREIVAILCGFEASILL